MQAKFSQLTKMAFTPIFIHHYTLLLAHLLAALSTGGDKREMICPRCLLRGK